MAKIGTFIPDLKRPEAIRNPELIEVDEGGDVYVGCWYYTKHGMIVEGGSMKELVNTEPTTEKDKALAKRVVLEFIAKGAYKIS